MDAISHCIRIYKQGGPEVLQYEEFSIGDPGPGEVRLMQEVIGVNFVDTMERDGTFEIDLPAILGCEAAGIVNAVGPGVDVLRVGDKVAYFYIPGSYATERIVAAESLVRLPEDVTTKEAAMFLAKGLTSWMGLRLFHPVKEGETILVHGASGGVGSILTRWAKALGAKVIGTTGTVEKLSAIASATDLAIFTEDPEFLKKVHTVASGGVDAVFDLVGKSTFLQSLSAVRTGGKIVSIGAASGFPEMEDPRLSEKNIQVAAGSVVGHVKGELIDKATAELFEKLRYGIFDDLHASTYMLSEAARVHADIASRRLTGPAVMVRDPGSIPQCAE